MSTNLPEKVYYRIGEVAELASVRTSVLRFWESEFVFLKPEKSSKGQRLYTKRDVDLILEVKRLLYQEKFTIEGVKNRINRGKILPVNDAVEPNSNQQELLKQVKIGLLEIRKQLNLCIRNCGA